ncbi:unnamed protein product [Microthlaspi erraticum]|nr:unnamed protein product [Microthlaspi erraticum]
MLATVIGGMGFGLMVNPPGGVWESVDCGSKSTVCTTAGTAVLGDDDSMRPLYLGMLFSSIISFSASMSLILLLVSGLGLRNRFVIAVMKFLMIVAVLCVSAAFFCTMAMIHPTLPYIRIAYLGIWGILAIVVLVLYGIRLIFPKPETRMGA